MCLCSIFSLVSLYCLVMCQLTVVTGSKIGSPLSVFLIETTIGLSLFDSHYSLACIKVKRLISEVCI